MVLSKFVWFKLSVRTWLFWFCFLQFYLVLFFLGVWQVVKLGWIFFSWCFCMQDLGRLHRSICVIHDRSGFVKSNNWLFIYVLEYTLLDTSPVFKPLVVFESSWGVEIAIHILMSGFPVISDFEVEEKDEGILLDSYLIKHAWAWVHSWTLAVLSEQFWYPIFGCK